MTAHTARAVRARRPRRCRIDSRHQIRVGDLYVRSVIFPGHDAHPGPGRPPMVGALCCSCAERYAGTAGLVAARLATGRDVPTRRGARAYEVLLDQLRYHDPGQEPWRFWGLAPAETMWPVPDPVDDYEFVWLHRPGPRGRSTFCKALVHLDTGRMIRSRPDQPTSTRKETP